MGDRSKTEAEVPDLSTFAGRWAEALGDPNSAEARDFRSYGGRLGDILAAASEQYRMLTRQYTDGTMDDEDPEVQKRPATFASAPLPVAEAPDLAVAAPAFAAASVDDEGGSSSCGDEDLLSVEFEDEDHSSDEDEDHTGVPSNENSMKFLDLGGLAKTKFLSLETVGQYFLVRPCYKALYETIVTAWSGSLNRVRVTGNPGTGKSWFQLYALRRLLQGYGMSHAYLFVIRQVGQLLHLIDLSDAQTRRLKVDQAAAPDALGLFKAARVLYFFEPLHDRSLLPLPLAIDSLTTLSPFEERIHEYDKDRLTLLAFPPWTFEHLATSAESDPKVHKRLKRESVAARFSRFGGIIRHVFAHDTLKAKAAQKAKIKDADLNVLCALTTGIDSDPKVEGKNVSGYLLSYCNIPTVGAKRFVVSKLGFTSDYVACEMRKKMQVYDIPQHIESVLKHLNGQLTDRGGMHLQEVVTFLLAKGTQVQWLYKQVTDAPNPDNPWLPFSNRVRVVVKNYKIDELLDATDKVLVSLNPNFPFADIVFSYRNVEAKQVTPGKPQKKKTKTNARKNIVAGMIDSFQVTWQLYHPFTVRALYSLRVNYLKIDDRVKLRVFFVAANKEQRYVARLRKSFLTGSVDVELKYSSNIKVPPSRLQLMWRNTEIYVLKPETSWQATLGLFRDDHS